jgi:hypothetical protein
MGGERRCREIERGSGRKKTRTYSKFLQKFKEFTVK